MLSFMKFCVAQTIFCQKHLDIVLEVLQVVESKFLLMKLVDIYQRKIHFKKKDGCFTNDGDIKLYNNRRKNEF